MLKLFSRLPKRKTFLSAAIATGLIAVAWWILVFFYEPAHLPASNSYYKSLDLSQAAQAVYVNKPIEVIKDFGIHSGVRKKLISFNVPKDGLSEYALMTMPQKQASSYPVIVLCHGYADPRAYSTLESYLSDMNFYSSHGYVVIKPDLRGNGFSLANGTPDGAYYSMSYNTDILSLIAAINSTNYLNKNNVNLWGHSMGGYLALRAAVLDPQVKNLILLSAPVGTAESMYKDYTAISDSDNSIASGIRNDQLAQHGTPLSDPTYWDKTSPLSYLYKLKAHVQIYVGARDKIVPPTFSGELNSKLNQLHIAHVYEVYTYGVHSLAAQRPFIRSMSLSVMQNP